MYQTLNNFKLFNFKYPYKDITIITLKLGFTANFKGKL